MTKKKGRSAEAYIEGGEIRIRVPIKLIPKIVSCSISAGYMAEGAKVIDATRFAKDIVNALNDEQEDGTTPVHVLLDTAFEKAIEDGSQGVELTKDSAWLRE
jgi:hypothetical protein